MSYPPALYTGEGGEVSAWVRRGDDEPDLVYPNGNRVHYLARGEATGGLFGLYRWEFAGPPSGPGAHFHRTISESFYVLDGVVSVFTGDAWVRASSGDFLHVPPGGLHGFRNEDGPATMLLHFAPGAPREAYFEGLAQDGGVGAMSEDQRAEFMAYHDTIWVPD
jgi:mannose-6-phosphate isomerase-like protein (cupin superfamily)